MHVEMHMAGYSRWLLASPQDESEVKAQQFKVIESEQEETLIQ